MGVATLYPSVSPEDEYIAPLLPGGPTSCLKRFLMGVEVARNPLGARLADSPTVTARNNVLALV